MTDNRIRSLTNIFREKIDRAQRKGLFVDTILEEFPVQCCGVASRLLAEFLIDNEVETLWISAEEFATHETHAWLVIKDDRIDPPRSCFDGIPDSITNILGKYGGENLESIREATCYEKQNIQNGLIVDITGNQFNEAPVYVGYMDNFHKRFDFVAAYEHVSFHDEELFELYKIIANQ